MTIREDDKDAKKPAEAAAASSEDAPVGLDRQIERFASRHDSREELRVSGDLRGSKARSAAEKFITRLTSGIIYVMAIMGCLFLGLVPTMILVSAMSWLCCSEFFHIVRMAGRKPNEIIGLGAAIMFPIACGFWDSSGIGFVLLVLIFLAACWYVFAPFANIADVSVTVFGPIYTSLLFSSVVLLRMAEPGLLGGFFTFAVMGSMWVNDSFAYLAGMAFGRHKLAPKISPAKTWEGFFGGLFGSVLVWVVFGIVWHFFGDLSAVRLPIIMCVPIGLFVGVMSVVGDLFESRLKRGAGVKDSGNFMPGHGGLLDRTDSLLFGCVTAYIILLLGGII